MKKDDQVMVNASVAGHPQPGLNLEPKTRRTPAAKLRVGHIVLESREHPAKIVDITYPGRSVVLHCRYIWQSKAETTWTLGPFHLAALLEKAI